MHQDYRLRRAELADLETLVAFALEEAREAEGKEIDVENVTRGVRTGLEDAAVATYWVAESGDHGVVANASVVTEWSNFHGGYYWWIQSLFIVPEHRGRGLVEVLLNTLADEARAAGAVDLRLYACNSNRRALEVYRRCGFGVAPYTIMTRKLGGR